MFYIVLIIVLVIGTLGVATYGGVMMLQATQGLSDTQTNSRRLEMVAWNLRNNGGVFWNGNQTYMARDSGAAYAGYSIPSPLRFAQPYTAGGINFHYCPYNPFNVSAGVSTLTTPGGAANYTYSSYTYGAGFDQYLIANSSIAADSDAPTGTMHVVTMPSPNAAMPPLCNALVKPNDTTTVPGGSAVEITARQLLNAQTFNAAQIMNLYVATAVSGDGTGRDAANAMTLAQAMDMWRAVQPRILTINLAAGTYSADSTVFSSGNLTFGNPLGLRLVWRGAGSGSTIINATGTVAVDLPVDFQIESLALGSTATTLYTRKGGNLILDGTALTTASVLLRSGTLTTVGAASSITSVNAMEINAISKLSLSAPLSFNTTSSLIGIKLFGGDIRSGGVTSNGTLAITVPTGGTGISVSAGTINLLWDMSVSGAAGAQPARGILAMPAAIISSRANIIVNNNPSVAAIDNAGSLTLYGANLRTPNGAAVGVRLISGGEFYLGGNGEIGAASPATARPIIGIQDLGGTKIGGGNATVPGKVFATTGGACWNFVAADSTNHASTRPTLFSRSKEGNGEISSPTDTAQAGLDFLVIDNRSYWTCTGPTPGLNSTPQTAPATITVSGAGASMANGTYQYYHDFFGGSDSWTKSSYNCNIFRDTNYGWVIQCSSTFYYYADGSSPYPPASGWGPFSNSAPAPILTFTY